MLDGPVVEAGPTDAIFNGLLASGSRTTANAASAKSLRPSGHGQKFYRIRRSMLGPGWFAPSRHAVHPWTGRCADEYQPPHHQLRLLGRVRLVALESLGIPLPGETALMIAGACVGSSHNLSPWAIFAVASAGAILGEDIGFWIGGKGGYRLARAYGPKIRLDERKLKIARYLFDAYGPKVVFFGRFTALLPTYAAFLAGASRMSWRRFLPANAAGGIVWAAGCTRSRRTPRS